MLRYPSSIRPVGTMAGAFLLAFVLAGCQEETMHAPEPVRPVKVVKIEASAASRQIVLSGSVKARTEAGIGFRVGGKIVERLVDVGDHVEPGTVLARLDTADLGLAVQSAEADVVSARARLDYAESALKRYQTLFAKGFVARSALDQRQLEFDQATSALKSAISASSQAANQAAYSDLKADAAGIVTQIGAEVGQVVNAGTPVVVVAREGDKEVEIAVPENEIRHFAAGDRLVARFWADPAIRQTGIVREVSGSADSASRTFAVRVSLPEDARVLLGMTATLTAEVATDDGDVVVPIAALAEQDGKPMVWVVDPRTQTVAARTVETGAFAAEEVRISSGLSTGDLVVTAGTQFMTPAKQVRIADMFAQTSVKASAIAAR